MKVRKIKLIEHSSNIGNKVRCVIDMTEKEYQSLLDKPKLALKEVFKICSCACNNTFFIL